MPFSLKRKSLRNKGRPMVALTNLFPFFKDEKSNKNIFSTLFSRKESFAKKKSLRTYL